MLNKDIEVTLLSTEEVCHSKVLQKVDASCGKAYWTRTPSYFFDHSYAKEYVVISSSGLLSQYFVDDVYGVRPVLKSDNLKELIKECKVTLENGIQIIEYGEFPHIIESVKIDDTSVLSRTGKEYVLPIIYGHNTTLKRLTEYDYKGEKVVKKGRLYYPVKPVKWYFDEENNMLIAKDILFKAPINIDDYTYNGSFETSQLYSYLNNDFLRQLLASAKINRVIADKPDDIALLEAELEKLEEQNQSKKGRINQLEALLTRQERLQAESAELDAKIAELTQKLNQKVKSKK